MSIHCYDVRIIKLIFTMDENKHLAPITTIPEVTQEMEKNGAVAVQSHQFRFMQKKMALPAITKKFKPCSTEMVRCCCDMVVVNVDRCSDVVEVFITMYWRREICFMTFFTCPHVLFKAHCCVLACQKNGVFV